MREPPLLALAAAVSMTFVGACRERADPPNRIDSGTRDAVGADVPNAPPRDGGPPGPDIDGVIDEDEWEGSALALLDEEPDVEGDVLTSLRAVIAGDRLVVGVEASLADGSALVVYVDRDVGGEEGLTDFAELSDREGILDNRLSTEFAVSDFGVDAAWGTTTLPRTPVGLDEIIGWRDLDTEEPNTFEWFASEDAPTVCSESACETAIPFALLGGTAPRDLALFARIVRSDGSVANQTLPEDDADNPSTVSETLFLTQREPELDAGVADGAIDAGSEDIVIDGNVGLAEWAGASVSTNATSTAATPFAGSALSTLRVSRTTDRLFISLEGVLASLSDHAMVVYVDFDTGGPGGIVGSPTPLNDLSGALDQALSKAWLTPAAFRMDFGWGTLDMSRSATVDDDRMGWRDLGDGDLFTPVAIGSAPSACSANACETAIDLAAAGAGAAATYGVYARLVAGGSAAVSNQTLPADDAFAPETISVFVSVPP